MVVPAQEQLESKAKSPDLKVQSESEKSVIPEKENLFKFGLRVSFFATLNVFVFKFIVSLEAFSEASRDLKEVFCLLFTLIAVGIFTLLAKEIFSEAFSSLKKGRISREVSCLLAASLLTLALFSSLYIDFEGVSLSFGYQTLIIVVFLLYLDRYTEESFLKHFFSKPHNKEPTAEESTASEKGLSEPGANKNLKSSDSTSSSKPGDVFYVQAGELIPCDSVVVSGAAELKERKLTGRGKVRIVRDGDEIFAGSEVVAGKLKCKVTNSLEESFVTTFASELESVSRDIEEEEQQRSALEIYSGFGLLFFAACAGVFWFEHEKSLSRSFGIAAAVLLISLLPRLASIFSVLRMVVINRLFSLGIFIKKFPVLRDLITVENVAIEYDATIPPGEIKLKDIKLIDDRIEEDSFTNMVLVLLGCSGDEADQAAVQVLRERLKTVELVAVSDFCFYPGWGLSGEIQGVEVSIGSEGFLLERGVQVRVSDLCEEQDNEFNRYVAIGVEVVGYLTFMSPFVMDGRELVPNLKKLGVNTVLLSRENDVTVKDLGKAVGLEPELVRTGLEEKVFLDLIEAKNPLALYANKNTAPSLLEKSAVSMTVFDELAWDVKSRDVTFFGKDVDLISTCIRLAKKWNWSRTFCIALISVVVPVLLLLSIMGIINSVLVALTVLCVSHLLYFVSWSLAGSRSE